MCILKASLEGYVSNIENNFITIFNISSKNKNLGYLVILWIFWVYFIFKLIYKV